MRDGGGVVAAVTAGTKLADLDLRPATLRALAKNGATVVGDLLDTGYTRSVVASWDGIGASRLADLDAAMGRHGMSYGRPLSDGFLRSCPDCKICPDCGNPRAISAVNVVVDRDGRASHVGHRVGPTCAGCDRRHRALFVKAAS